jgi:predicted regulator of Ras-like GTPase activity (Roadblock/LC7/MglB family)
MARTSPIGKNEQDSITHLADRVASQIENQQLRQITATRTTTDTAIRKSANEFGVVVTAQGKNVEQICYRMKLISLSVAMRLFAK